MLSIRELRATPVRVRRLPRFLPKTAHGEVPASEYVIVELLTEEGVIGLGEVTCSPRWNGEEAAGSAALLRGPLSEALAGLDAQAWRAVLARVDEVVRSRPFLRAAVEMACLDAIGRARDIPVACVLGGPLHEEFATKLVLPARPVEQVRAMALDLKSTGVSSVKVKVGTALAEDLARVTAVREVFGTGALLTVDANEGWTSQEARHAVAELARLGVVAIEQPLARTSDLMSGALRQLTTAAIVADESVWTIEDVARVWAQGSFDAVSLYPGKCGGIETTVMLAQLADNLGLGITFGSNLELGVGAAALAHAIAASPVATVPSDLIGPLYFESPLVVDAAFVGWGRAVLPRGPGLGVTLDADAVQRNRVDR